MRRRDFMKSGFLGMIGVALGIGTAKAVGADEEYRDPAVDEYLDNLVLEPVEPGDPVQGEWLPECYFGQTYSADSSAPVSPIVYNDMKLSCRGKGRKCNGLQA